MISENDWVMNESPVIVQVGSISEATARIDALSEVFRKYGALIIPGLMRHDDYFLSYERDLKELLVRLLEKNGLPSSPKESLDEIITRTASVDRTLIGNIYDIGTRPIKLVSGTRLKTHPFVISLLDELFDGGPVAFPYLGETLHVFPPGKENERYNLPIHQDYPYLMQSSEQVTAYFNFGHRRSPDIGGVRFWLGSHVDGITPARRTELGHWESVVSQDFKTRFEQVDYVFDYGDFAIFDSLLQHSGIKNRSNQTRLVQLVRYSNLGNAQSIDHSWQSAQRDGRGVSFDEVHPELVVEETS